MKLFSLARSGDSVFRCFGDSVVSYSLNVDFSRHQFVYRFYIIIFRDSSVLFIDDGAATATMCRSATWFLLKTSKQNASNRCDIVFFCALFCITFIFFFFSLLLCALYSCNWCLQLCVLFLFGTNKQHEIHARIHLALASNCIGCMHVRWLRLLEQIKLMSTARMHHVCSMFTCSYVLICSSFIGRNRINDTKNKIITEMSSDKQIKQLFSFLTASIPNYYIYFSLEKRRVPLITLFQLHNLNEFNGIYYPFH